VGGSVQASGPGETSLKLNQNSRIQKQTATETKREGDLLGDKRRKTSNGGALINYGEVRLMQNRCLRGNACLY